MGSWKLGVAIVLSSLGLGSVAQAVPLNLTQGTPDITSSFITTTYIAGGGAGNFTSSGFTAAIDFDGIAPPDVSFIGGSWDIVATIDAAGNASGGTLNVTGDDGSGMQTLLTGTLSAFGFGSSTDPLEFIFDVTGGTQAANFGAQAGVILTAGASSNYAGAFSQSFSNTGLDGSSDTFGIPGNPVPEPLTATMGAIALAGAGLAAVRRRSC